MEVAPEASRANDGARRGVLMGEGAGGRDGCGVLVGEVAEDIRAEAAAREEGEGGRSM